LQVVVNETRVVKRSQFSATAPETKQEAKRNKRKTPEEGRNPEVVFRLPSPFDEAGVVSDWLASAGSRRL